VENLNEVAAIAAGSSHVLALKKNGTVWSFGLNIKGGLGDGTYIDRQVPVQVKGGAGDGFLTDVQIIDANYLNSAALKKDGTVWTWGDNGQGQLGSLLYKDSNVPVQVNGIHGLGKLTNTKAISLGYMHSTVIDGKGKILGWGANYYGQIGDSTIENASFLVETIFPVHKIEDAENQTIQTTGKLKIVVNGVSRKFNTEPIYANGSMLISLRDFSTVLDASVHWNPIHKQIEIQRGSTQIVLKINESIARINNQTKKLSQPAINVKNQTYIPIRFLSEAFGATVAWNPTNQTLTVKVL
jgi:hypothetical protein